MVFIIQESEVGLEKKKDRTPSSTSTEASKRKSNLQFTSGMFEMVAAIPNILGPEGHQIGKREG